ncbi:MAG: hypothetical protein K0R47_2828 [Brevibacillus sp.]|nr:hypothetical protein [Brevibacillus sp.]
MRHNANSANGFDSSITDAGIGSLFSIKREGLFGKEIVNMANELVYTTVIDELLNTIPELKPLYAENTDMWLDDYLPYVVFGFVVVPIMEELLQNDWQSPILKGIFEFIEIMMLSEHDDVQTLAAVEIAEWIAFENNPVIQTNAIKLMGPETLKEMNSMINWKQNS